MSCRKGGHWEYIRLWFYAAPSWSHYNECLGDVEVSLAHGADQNSKAIKECHTPLHEVAAKNPSPDVLHVAFTAGADPIASSGKGPLLFGSAATNESPAVIETLLKPEIDLNASDDLCRSRNEAILRGYSNAVCF